MGLTDDDVREILRIIDESRLDELRIDMPGFQLHVRRGGAPLPAAEPPPARPPAPAARAAPPPGRPPPPGPPRRRRPTVALRAPSPGPPPTATPRSTPRCSARS